MQKQVKKKKDLATREKWKNERNKQKDPRNRRTKAIRRSRRNREQQR